MCNDRIISAEPIQNDETMRDGENRQTENIEEVRETENEHGNEHGHEQEQEQKEEEKPNNEPIENHVQESKEEEEEEEENHMQETENHDIAHNGDISNAITNGDDPPKNSDQVSLNR